VKSASLSAVLRLETSSSRHLGPSCPCLVFSCQLAHPIALRGLPLLGFNRDGVDFVCGVLRAPAAFAHAGRGDRGGRATPAGAGGADRLGRCPCSRSPNRFNLDGVDYVFGVLPFGLRSSAAIFPHFASAAATALRALGLTRALIAYVDDLSISVQDTSLDLLGCYLGTAALGTGGSPYPCERCVCATYSFGTVGGAAAAGPGGETTRSTRYASGTVRQLDEALLDLREAPSGRAACRTPASATQTKSFSRHSSPSTGRTSPADRPDAAEENGENSAESIRGDKGRRR